MDLSLREEDEQFASAFRAWLGEHLVAPPAFVVNQCSDVND